MEAVVLILAHFALLGWVYVLSYNGVKNKYNNYRVRRKVHPI